jgi:hypothetical protein
MTAEDNIDVESYAPKPKRVRKTKAQRYDMGKPVAQAKQSAFNPFNVVVPNNWIDRNTGEECTSWTKVGAAWPIESGKGWTIKICSGISVSGAIYLFPNDREKE